MEFGVRMRLPFCIFKLGDGNPHFVDAAPTLDAAKARVTALAELWPAEYVIIHKKERGGEILLEICYKPPRLKRTKGRWVAYEHRLI